MRAGLRKAHRWLGIASLVFLLLLCVTGVALNHTEALRLDERYVHAAWLLDWYGIKAPDPNASFLAGSTRVTLLGGRLFVGEREIASGIESLKGAVETNRFVAAVTPDTVFLATSAGDLIERIDLGSRIEARADALGVLEDRLVFRAGERLYRADPEMLAVEPWEGHAQRVRWSRPAAVPPEELAALQQRYRGEGVTVERLLADLHGGRFLGPVGPFIVDVAGFGLVALGITGLVIWFVRNGGRK